MELIRGCLMTLGLIMLLMITSCVVGLSSFGRGVNPTEFGRTISEDAAKSRRMLRDFLAAAELDRAQVSADQPLEVSVQDFSDGSIHMIGTSNGRKLIEVTALVTPVDADAARVEVISDARPLAEEARGVSAPALHRAIRDRLDGAMSAIDRQQVLPGGFLVSRILDDARAEQP
jgi:hypothetical protein